jgi:hypothetical protein
MSPSSEVALLQLAAALGVQEPWAQRPRTSASPPWIAELHGITHWTGPVIFWTQLKTFGDAQHWVRHVQECRPDPEAQALKHLLEEILKFSLDDERSGTEYLGTSAKVRKFKNIHRRT